MKKILVTGADGQLAKCIKKIAATYSHLTFTFLNKESLDITQEAQVFQYFEKNHIDFCINTAAYTNVEKAESDKEQAFLVNAEATKYLAQACEKNGVTLLHISTDYVFNGEKREPYLETDKPNPLNEYGNSKLKGEAYIKMFCKKYFIIRTSWLYSQYGHNFYKSILKLARQKDQLTVTNGQTGCPTNANDLAYILLQIIEKGGDAYGIYHFSNAGEATWYDFAQAIIVNSRLSQQVSIVKTNDYPTFAKRPKYSVLSLTKTQKLLQLKIPHWEQSLKQLIQQN